MTTATKRPRVRLFGQDGNAYAIIGACRRAALKAGWAPEQWDAVQNDMTSGDYDHLLMVALKHFDVE